MIEFDHVSKFYGPDGQLVVTIAANVAVVPRLLGWSEVRTRPRVDELLAMVHLSPEQYRDRLPRELSGGQQ